MSRTRPQEGAFEGFRWHYDGGFQVGEHVRFGAKFESLDGAIKLNVENPFAEVRSTNSCSSATLLCVQVSVLAPQNNNLLLFFTFLTLKSNKYN